MYYYLFKNGENIPNIPDREKWLYIPSENFLKCDTYSFSELLTILNDKIKEVSLIDLLCQDKIDKNLIILSKVVKDMRDTNCMYVRIIF